MHTFTDTTITNTDRDILVTRVRRVEDELILIRNRLTATNSPIRRVAMAQAALRPLINELEQL